MGSFLLKRHRSARLDVSPPPVKERVTSLAHRAGIALGAMPCRLTRLALGYTRRRFKGVVMALNDEPIRACVIVHGGLVEARSFLRSGEYDKARDRLAYVKSFMEGGKQNEVGIPLHDSELSAYFKHCICPDPDKSGFLRFDFYAAFILLCIDRCVVLVDGAQYEEAEMLVDAIHALPSAVFSNSWNRRNYWKIYLNPYIARYGEWIVPQKIKFFSFMTSVYLLASIMRKHIQDV